MSIYARRAIIPIIFQTLSSVQDTYDPLLFDDIMFWKNHISFAVLVSPQAKKDGTLYRIPRMEQHHGEKQVSPRPIYQSFEPLCHARPFTKLDLQNAYHLFSICKECRMEDAI